MVEQIPIDRGLAVEQVTRDNSDIKGIHRRPNILYILIDDASVDMMSAYNSWAGTNFGYGGAPNYANTAPNINTYIGSVGIKFNNFWTMPVCSSHRASVLTGRYPTRHGCGNVTMPHFASSKYNELGGTWSTEYTIAHLAKDAGYRTLWCGKGHLALQESGEQNPTYANETTYPFTGSGWIHPVTSLGFEEFRGPFRNISNQAPEPPDGEGSVDHAALKPGYYNYFWNEVTATTEDPTNSYTQIDDQHITRYSRQRLADWITTPGGDAGKPWFAYWALNGIHSPFGERLSTANPTTADSGCMPPNSASDAADYASYWHTNPTQWADTTAGGSAAACLENIDVEIGLLRDELGSEVWDNTMVFFVADNGSDATVMQSLCATTGTPASSSVTGASQRTAYGDWYTDVIANGAPRMKTSIYSGGTRGTMLVAGPLVLGTPGRDSNTLVDSVDLFETFRQIVGGNKETNNTIPDNSERTYDSISFYDVLRDHEATTGPSTLRTTSFSERFYPNGSALDITDTADQTLGGQDSLKERVYRKIRSGSVQAARDGQYHYIRRLNGTTYDEELYQITGSGGDDYNETTDVSLTYAVITAEMSAEMDALIADMDADPTHIT